MSARTLISSGSTFEREIGYSRAVVQGDWVFVSGTTGFDYATMTIAEGVEAQAEQCLRNIAAALTEAGAALADVVRVHYILPDAAEFPACWPILRRYFGDVRPAATMIAAAMASAGPDFGSQNARTMIASIRSNCENTSQPRRRPSRRDSTGRSSASTSGAHRNLIV